MKIFNKGLMFLKALFNNESISGKITKDCITQLNSEQLEYNRSLSILNSILNNFKGKKEDYRLCLPRKYLANIRLMKDKDGSYIFNVPTLGNHTIGGFQCAYLPLYNIYLVKKSIAKEGEEIYQKLHELFLKAKPHSKS